MRSSPMFTSKPDDASRNVTRSSGRQQFSEAWTMHVFLALAPAAQAKAEFMLWAPPVLPLTNEVLSQLWFSWIGAGSALSFDNDTI